MSRGHFPRFRYASLLLVLTLPFTAPGAFAGVPPADKRADPAAVPAGLSSLPPDAQWSISAALGRDQRAYHAEREGETWRLDNARHGLRAGFTAEGVEVQSGAARFELRLTGLGRGARVEAPSPATPEAKANRIEYRRSGLTEWYVNGPLGLEQGFTLDRPPARATGEALTLALKLSGGVTATPDPQGDGVALETRAGSTVLRYRGLVAWDATGRALPAWWQIAGPEVRLRVDDHAARYPVVIDPFFQQAKLTASDGAERDDFGRSVAVSGDTIVVGANLDDSGFSSFGDEGSAYVFVKPVGGWAGALTETAKLTASDGEELDGFGLSVAVSGDTVVVGAREHLRDRPDSAYVFVKPPGGWVGVLTETAKLTPSDRLLFFTSVAVSGDTVVVGAAIADFIPDSAYVFVKPPGGWVDATEDAKLTASDGAVFDSFGVDVAVGGDTVVVGAFEDDIGDNLEQGSAYVFVKPLAGWGGALNQSAKLTASDGAFRDSLGISVAVSGDTVVAGACHVSPLGPDCGQGSAYVFVKPAGGWTGPTNENAKLTASDGGGPGGGDFGRSVAVSGDTVVVGAPSDTTGNNLLHGSAYVFVKPPGGWAGALTESVKLIASDGADHRQELGSSVAVSGDTVVGGAPGPCLSKLLCRNQNPGSAYVFNLSDILPPPPPPPPSGCTVNGVSNQVCRGTRGRDTIIGTSGPDVIFGLEGNDTIRGKGGNDRIVGGPGRDRLIGGRGNDRLQGDAGNDTLAGGPGRDRLNGGKGRDRCKRDAADVRAASCE